MIKIYVYQSIEEDLIFLSHHERSDLDKLFRFIMFCNSTLYELQEKAYHNLDLYDQLRLYDPIPANEALSRIPSLKPIVKNRNEILFLEELEQLRKVSI